jgi:hypothetical protein
VVALLVGLAVALADVVRLEVTPDHLVEGQVGTASVVVVTDGKGAVAENGAPPPLPAGPGLQATFAGQTQQYTNRNGRISRIRRFQYELAAVQAGDWLVGPVELRLQDGTSVVAQPVRVHVGLRESAEVGEEVPLLESAFDTERAWEGEIVLYRYGLTLRRQGAAVEWRLPDFEGLRLPRHAEPIERSFDVGDPGGTLTVHEGVVPLVAVGAGKRDQPAATVAVRVPLTMSDLLGSPRRTAPEFFTTRPAPLEVFALPPAPPGFTGIVGDVTVTSEVEAADAAVGSSVPWTIRITGDASLDVLSLPAYEADGVSVYDGDTAVQARIDGSSFVAAGEVRRVLVPTAEGHLDLPDFSLVTFSPTEGRYVTHTVSLPEIEVAAGREGAGGAIQRFGTPAADSAGAELSSSLRQPYATGRATVPRLDPWIAPLLAAAAGPGIVVLLAEGIARGRSFVARRRSQRQRVPAARDVLSRLPPDGDDRLAALDHALRLLEARAPGDAELRDLRRRLGRARFGGGPPDLALAADLEVAARRLEEGRAA